MIAGADKVTIGVFEDNIPAYYCYISAGFEESSAGSVECVLFGETRIIKELEISKEQYIAKFS